MILVFKTNISTSSLVSRSKRQLNKLLPEATWNFDLEDCDNILRIDSHIDISKQLKAEMYKLGIEIEELPD